MAKVRVYVLAKELGLTNEETLRELKKLGLNVTSSLDQVDDEVAQHLRGKKNLAGVKVTRVEEKIAKKRPAKKEEGAPEEPPKPKKPPKPPKPEEEEKPKKPVKVGPETITRKTLAASRKKEAQAAAPAVSTEAAHPAPRIRVVRRARPVPPAAEAAPPLETVPIAPADTHESAEVSPPAIAPEETPAQAPIEFPAAVAEAPPMAAAREAHPAPAEKLVPTPIAKTPSVAAAPLPPSGPTAPLHVHVSEDRRDRPVTLRPTAPVVRGRPGADAGLLRKRVLGRAPSAARVVPKLRRPPEGESRKKRRESPFAGAAVQEIRLTEGITVKELAEKLQQKSRDVIQKLLERGHFVSINQTIDTGTAVEVARAFGVKADVVTFEEDLILRDMEHAKVDTASAIRPPIVTVMGHVDHGKTSLLDAVRKTNVAAREAGGITQHIGAYRVNAAGKWITFLDTPGHEAFTLMRSRGARATDIVILVVAADDGVMPQTLEAINHAKAAGVPLVVAINKVDKPNADPDRVKRQLSEHDVLVEEWGGKVVCVPVSAKKVQGLTELLDMVLLVADMQDLRATPEKTASGVVLEAKLDRARGPVATVLVQDGTLRTGDIFVAGSVLGKVRAMFDENGERVPDAAPSIPVEVLGLEAVPEAGDSFQVVQDESRARKMTSFRQAKAREKAMGPVSRMTLDHLFQKIQEEGVKELPIVLKADVQGSAEVLAKTVSDLSSDKVRVRLIHTATGAISESDILLAAASNAIVIGFNVRPERSAASLAEKEGVDVRLYTVIYEVTKEIGAAMQGMLEPTIKEVFLGRAEVREVFNLKKVGTIAGCMVTDGKVTRSAQVRLLRDNVVVHEGRIASLKRFKEDAGEVRSGFDCGIILAGYQDVKKGDVIEAYLKQEVPAGATSA